MKFKRVVAVVLSAAMVLGAAACGQKPSADNGQKPSGDNGQNSSAEEEQKDTEETADGKGDSGKVIEVSLPTYKTGENAGAAYFEPMIERFNTKYEGKYHITIEEVTQDVYPEKLKQLGQQGKLPFFIEGGDTTWMNDVVIPGEMFYDLSEFVASHPEVKDLISEEAMAYNTTKDGKIVTLMTPIMYPVSMYYNEALYKPSKDFAEMSWDDVAAELCLL